LRTEEGWISGAVRLAEGMAAGDQRHGFLVIHCHTPEGLTDVMGRGDGIRFAIGSFRIHIDEAHLHRAERILQLALTAVALVAQPVSFGTPVELCGLPRVRTTTAEAEGLEAHRLERDVAGEDVQIGPGDLTAIFLFDRPEKAASLVEVGIVGPAVEWREAL